MHWKTTAVLLGLTVAVGAYVSLYELRQPDREARRRQATEVWDVPDDAARLRLAWAGRPEVVLVRDGASWRLTPGGYRADLHYVEGVLGALRLHASRTLTPHALAEFGLAPPEASLTIDQRTLLIGRLTPVPGSRYVKLADRPEVHVVDAAAIEAADKPAEHFRDRALLRVEPWEMHQVVWVDRDRVVKVSRSGDAWQLGDPPQPADDQAVMRWLAQWSSLPISAFVNDAAQPADRDAAQLGAPAQRLELTLDGGRTLTVSLGAAVPEHPELRYAGRDDEPAQLYGVAEADLDVLEQSSEGLEKNEAPAEVAPGA